MKKAEKNERSEIARTQLRTILNNIDAADSMAVPMCQDTGIHVFFVSGRITPGIEDRIRAGTLLSLIHI